eukprot:s1634_g1.t3
MMFGRLLVVVMASLPLAEASCMSENQKNLHTCAKECSEKNSKAACVSDCLIDLKVPSTCASCLGTQVDCGRRFCATECSSGNSSSSCFTCLDTKCSDCSKDLNFESHSLSDVGPDFTSLFLGATGEEADGPVSFLARQAGTCATGGYTSVPLANEQFTERRRLTAKSHREQKEVWSPGLLKKMAIARLQERCRSHGLVCSGKTKKDLVDALIRYCSAGFTSKEWSKLSVDDLKAHLESRKLSAAGRKPDLVFRLSEAPLPFVEFGLGSTREMKQWLRDFGLPTGGKATASDVAERYMTVKQRVFEEESSIRKLGQDTLRDLVPDQAGADPDDLKEVLGKCHAIARSEDLGKVTQTRLSNKEHCWVDCIRRARENLDIEGFALMSPDAELFQQLQKCFAEECAKLRF